MPRTCADAINASLAKLARHEPIAWQTRHAETFRAWGHFPANPAPFGHEAAVVQGIKAAAIYADAHAARFGSPIGEDGVLGPCFASILAGLLGLLNGETGRLDCGTLDGLIREIGRLAGVVDENGEIRE